MLRHKEEIARVSDVRASLNVAGTFYVFELDVTTTGGINKTIRLPQHVAAQLARTLQGEFDELGEQHTADEGRAMFYASVGRKAS